MKYIIIFITSLLFLCINSYAQERFNNVYYDPDGNISNSVHSITNGYLALNGTDVNGKRGFTFTITNLSGEVSLVKEYGLESYNLYEGLPNCLKYNESTNGFYLTGVVEEIYTYERMPFISIFDVNIDTTKFTIIDMDSVFGAYDIVRYNDSLYGIVTANTIPDDYEMGLLIYDINNDTILYHCGYGSETLNSNEVGTEIVLTKSRNYLLGGFTFRFGTSTFKQDWYLVKTDSIGNMIWERHFGNPIENDGRIMAMLESRDSSYVVAGGQAICNWSMNPISEAALRKIDTAGNLVWEKFYRNYMYRESAEQMWFSETYCTDIIELEYGNFACLFSIQKQIGSKSFMLVKLSSSGDVLWTKRLETYNYEGTFVPSSIKQTADNGFILYGHGSISLGQQFWLIKTDSLGNEGALYTTPPPENIECPDFPDTMYCSETYSSRLRVQGKSAPYTIEFSTGEIIENLYYPPVFLPESHGTGSFITYVGTDEYPQQYDTATLYGEIPSDDIIELPLSITLPENYFGPDLIATITNGYGESYEIVLPVYVDCNVNTDQQKTVASAKIYPNPANDYLQISLPKFEENSFVKIINSLGQTVMVEQLFEKEKTLNIKGLNSGSYIVRIYSANQINNYRIEKL